MKKLCCCLLFSLPVLLSACSPEGDLTSNPEVEGTLGAAIEESTPTGGVTTDGAGENAPDSNIDNTESSTDTSAVPGATTSGESGESTTNTGQTTTPAISSPAISFQGTSLGSSYEVDDPIVLDASYSTVGADEVMSFLWEQVENGKPRVTLTNANTATASFPATAEIDGQRLSFRLTVTSSGGGSSTSALNYSWQVNAPETETGTTESAPVIAEGTYIMGQSGAYFAESVDSVYVTNQVNFNIEQVNPHTNSILNSYQQTAMPTELAFVESTQSLYGALSATGSLTRIDLDTGTQTQIAITGEALSMDGHNGRLYYTVNAAQPRTDFELFSVGDDNLPTSHGFVEGDLIEHNPVIDELVAVFTGSSPSKVYRYGLTATTVATELQNSTDLGGPAEDIAISADGQHLAIAMGGGNGARYTIFDIQPTDLTVSSGEWDTGAYPRAADFSKSGAWFAATDFDQLLLFNAVTHAPSQNYVYSKNLCGLNYDRIDTARFSFDDKYVFAKHTCGFDKEKTILMFYALP